MPTKISASYVLEQLQNIIEDDEVSDANKLKALKMVGEHLKMFESTKRSQNELRLILTRLDGAQLEGLTNGRQLKERSSVIEMEDTGSGYRPISDTRDDAG